MITGTLAARIAAAAAAVLVVASIAAAQDVTYNARPGVDFAKYRTYKWVKIEGAKYPNDITDGQIKAAIDAQLAAKGLVKQPPDANADLDVAYQVAVGQEQEWHTYGVGMGWGGYGPGWGHGGTATTTSNTIHVGMLALDIYDAAAKQLIWRGSASKTLDEDAKPEKRQKNLERAMKKLLKYYPPPEQKKD